MLDEMLGQGNDFGIQLPKIGCVLDHPNFIGPGTGHQARPGGTANGLLTVRPVKAHAFLGKFIQVRRLGDSRPIATKLGAQVVDGDEKDVRTPIGTVRNC